MSLTRQGCRKTLYPAALRPADFVSLHVGVGGIENRIVDARLARLARQQPDDLLPLGGVSRLDVAQHRGRIGRGGVGEQRAVARDEFLARRMAIAPGDLDRGIEHALEQPGTLAGAHDLAEVGAHQAGHGGGRSAEDTAELQSLMRLSYAVVCLIKKKHTRVSIIYKYR